MVYRLFHHPYVTNITQHWEENLTQDQVPIEPYLEPTQEYLTKWERIIPPSDKFKV